MTCLILTPGAKLPKSISAQLLTDIQKAVTTLALCVEITRKDGAVFRLTNHDQTVVFDGQTYTETIPFNVSAIDSGSQLAIDNTTLTLFCDGTLFVLDDFKNGLFDYSEVNLFFVDYENPSHGKMTMRRGWFGRIERNTRNYVEITITGLLKVLDFEVGRVYQPTCDADFGDARCKVSVNQNQAYSTRNPYRAGDWVYYYDSALMTAVTLTNPGFESDGSRSETDSITGWTKGPGAAFFVQTVPTSPNFGLISAQPTPVQGSYALYSSDDATDSDSGFENYLYKTITLTGTAGADVVGLSAVNIDAGRISMKYTVALAHNIYLLDPLKIRVEIFDTTGAFLTAFDSGWQFLDKTEVWRDRSLVFPLYPGARTMRLYIYMRKEDGAIANCCADDVRLTYWDHSTGTPYDSAVHRVSRLIGFDEANVKKPKNPSFEADGFISNADNPVIKDWTTGAGNWWRITNSTGPLSPDHGSLFLAGGDDGGIVQRTYTITQTLTISSLTKIDASRLALGKYMTRFRSSVYFGDAGLTSGTIKLEIKNLANTVLATHFLLNATNSGSIGIATPFKDFVLPATANKFTITLQAISPVGDGDASKIAFDNMRFWITDAERPAKGDPVQAFGDPASTWDTDPGDYTPDGNINWKAMQAYLDYDTVASVTSNKQFVATLMAGSNGTYETGVIWWLSGNNAGLRNIIRTWNSSTKAVKLYFQEPNPIQTGDRFIYIRSCQRRFTQDCKAVFENVINFRGFPFLPGKLTSEDVAAESPTVNPDTP